MVELALPILSTESPIFKESDKEQFEVVDSGRTQFPNDVSPTPYLDVVSLEDEDKTKYRFALNWTNQKNLQSMEIQDTEELHERYVEITVEDTVYKNKPTKGLRITGVD